MTHFRPLFFKSDPFLGPKMTPFLASLGIFCHFPALFGRLSERSDLDRIFRFEKKIKKIENTREMWSKSEIFHEKMTKNDKKMTKNGQKRDFS